MVWEAFLYDGTKKSEELGDSFSELKSESIDSLVIRENTASQSFIFDLDSNRLKILNLDASREYTPHALSMIYDKRDGTFHFNESSLEFLKNNILTEDYFYMSFGVLSTGDLMINGAPLHLDILDNQKESLIPKDGRKVSYIRNAFSDYMVGTKGNSKSFSGLESIEVMQELSGYTKHGFIVLKEKLTFEYSTRAIKLDLNIMGSFDLERAVIEWKTPDRSFSCPTVVSKTTPVHLNTYIYTFNN